MRALTRRLMLSTTAGAAVAASLPVAAQTSAPADTDWTSYGGGGYWFNPGAGNRNYWFAGWELQNQVTKQLMLGGEIFHQTADRDGGKPSTSFNAGGVFDFSENYHLLFSGGRGLQNPALTNQFSYYLAIQWTS